MVSRSASRRRGRFMAFDSVISPLVGLSPALTILLDHEGPKTAPDTGTGPLGLAELALIERLVRGNEASGELLDEIATATGVDRSRLETFLEALAEKNLVTGEGTTDEVGPPSSLPADGTGV